MHAILVRAQRRAQKEIEIKIGLKSTLLEWWGLKDALKKEEIELKIAQSEYVG
jgi:hypothetical protein